MKQNRQYKNTHFTRWGTWEAVIQVDGRIKRKSGFNTEREAAVQVDKFLLEAGKQPINILKSC
jgi:hypothetical protein